jgi:hypothetical protein
MYIYICVCIHIYIYIYIYTYHHRLKGENGEGFFPPWTSSNSMESASIQDQEKIGSLNTVYHNGVTYAENKFVDCYESEGHIVEELKCEDRGYICLYIFVCMYVSTYRFVCKM